MEAFIARNIALDKHPLYQLVLAAIQTAITASPPQFKCEVYLGSDLPYGTIQALTTKLRSDFYSVKYNEDTCFLSIDWCSLNP